MRTIYGKKGIWKGVKALVLRWHPIWIQIDAPGNYYHNWIFATDFETLDTLFYI